MYRWGDPRDSDFGDVHFYDYQHDCVDISHFPAARFISEYGYQSFPSFQSWKAISSESDWSPYSQLTNFRQRHPSGTEELFLQIAKHFDISQASFNGSDFSKFLYLSQVIQSWCYASAFSFWRQNMGIERGKTMGILYWQLNDVWQAPTWSSIEYGGKWKLLHYQVKKSFASVSISAHEREPGRLSVFLTSDSSGSVSANCSITCMDWKVSEILCFLSRSGHCIEKNSNQKTAAFFYIIQDCRSLNRFDWKEQELVCDHEDCTK